MGRSDLLYSYKRLPKDVTPLLMYHVVFFPSATLGVHQVRFSTSISKCLSSRRASHAAERSHRVITHAYGFMFLAKLQAHEES